MTTHIGPNGPGECGAQNGRCPYGGESGRDLHFDTPEEAAAAYEEMMGGSLGGAKLQTGSSSGGRGNGDDGRNNIGGGEAEYPEDEPIRTLETIIAKLDKLYAMEDRVILQNGTPKMWANLQKKRTEVAEQHTAELQALLDDNAEFFTKWPGVMAGAHLREALQKRLDVHDPSGQAWRLREVRKAFAQARRERQRKAKETALAGDETEKLMNLRKTDYKGWMAERKAIFDNKERFAKLVSESTNITNLASKLFRTQDGSNNRKLKGLMDKYQIEWPESWPNRR